MSFLRSVQYRTVTTVYKNFRKLVTSSKTLKREEISNEAFTTYKTKNDVDVYSQLIMTNLWLIKSLDFSLLSKIPKAANASNDCSIDLACGNGRLCRALVSDEYSYKTIVGVDKSVEMIMKAKQMSSDFQLKNITFKVDDCSSMDEQFMFDFKSTFDVVTCQWLYVYAENIEQLSKMIANAAALVKSGGVHVGCTLNPLIFADGMVGFSEQWKEFSAETLATADMIKSGRNHFIDGEIISVFVSAVEMNEKMSNEREIGFNCIEFKNYFYGKKTYNELFADHGFCDIHWLTNDEELAHPALSQLEQGKHQRYLRNNPSHSLFVMRKK